MIFFYSPIQTCLKVALEQLVVEKEKEMEVLSQMYTRALEEKTTAEVTRDNLKKLFGEI